MSSAQGFVDECKSHAAQPTSLIISQPDDFHHHLRDGDALRHTVPWAARTFSRVLVMPNLVPPVTTTRAALDYRQRILEHVPEDCAPHFEPLMSLYLTDETTPAEIVTAAASGHVYAAKLYPAGATTNSGSGVTDIAKIFPALRTMQEVGILLLVHGESTDPEIDVFDREARFYRDKMPAILAHCPDLRVVCEHVTTAEVCEFVESHGDNVAATITAHHLRYNRNALFHGGLRPHFYCLPLLKTEADRKKLVECAANNPKFFLGTDSAPHPIEQKECSQGCAGCFTAHASVELVAEALEMEGVLSAAALQDFVSLRGGRFYRLQEKEEKEAESSEKRRGKKRSRRLVRETWLVPSTYELGSSRVSPLGSGAEIAWKLMPRE